MTDKWTRWEERPDGSFGTWTPWLWAPNGRRYCNYLQHNGKILDTKWMEENPKIASLEAPAPNIQPPPPVEGVKAAPPESVVKAGHVWIWDEDYRKYRRGIIKLDGMSPHRVSNLWLINTADLFR